MPKKLVLHIGHYKTGTTALQVFAHRNRDFLAQQGIDYPNLWQNHSKHSAYLFSILKQVGVTKIMYGYDDPTPPRRIWRDLFAHIEGSAHPVTLISSEEFMRIGQFPEAAALLGEILDERPDGLEIEAIAYLRPPGPHLRSWYNQLIKMNFPVADFGSALNGDIEEIHYDYRRAFEPWMQLLGPERVHVRPYRFDRNNPAALHQDFFGVFGVTLPEELCRIEKDPNPRLDDRVIELVRLMQNLDFPRPTINAIRRQALTYIDAQDARALETGAGSVPDIDVAGRARDGLDWLDGQPGVSISPEEFARELPRMPGREEIDRNLMLGFVFSEFIQLRQKVNGFDIQKMNERISALEARGGKDRT